MSYNYVSYWNQSKLYFWLRNNIKKHLKYCTFCQLVYQKTTCIWNIIRRRKKSFFLFVFTLQNCCIQNTLFAGPNRDKYNCTHSSSLHQHQATPLHNKFPSHLIARHVWPFLSPIIHFFSHNILIYYFLRYYVLSLSITSPILFLAHISVFSFPIFLFVL